MSTPTYWSVHNLPSDGDLEKAVSRMWDVDLRHELGDLVAKRLTGKSGATRADVTSPITRWDPAIQVACRTAGPYHDFVAGTSTRPVVSSRFKELLEREAPGQVQFLPVVMLLRGRVLLVKAPYWVANYLIQIDCISASVAWEPSRYPEWREFLEEPRIDLARVPKEAEIFSVVHRPAPVVISGRLRDAIRRARMTGIYFMKERAAAESGRPHSRAMPLVIPVAPRFEAAQISDERPPSRRPKSPGRDRADVLAQLVALAESGDAEVGTGASPHDIAAAEHFLKVKFPPRYRAFLKQFGSATISGVEVSGIRHRRRSSGLPAYTVTELTAKFRKWKQVRWPEHMLCIVDDGRGGSYCLDTSKTCDGDCPVLYFDHEAMEPGDGPARPRFKRTAPTFQSWIRRIITTGGADA